jgi:hypothetical protein
MAARSEEEIIAKLNNSIIWAKYDFLQHQRAFLGSKREIHAKIIQATAPDFFRQLNGLLWDRMILSLSKLTDSYDDGRNKSLSMGYLVHVASQTQMKCSSELGTLFQECQLRTKEIRKYRSKVVAHKDLSTAFYSTLAIQIAEIELAFNAIERMMNVFHLERSETTWSFDLGGAKDIGALFYFLEKGLIYDALIDRRNDWRLDMIEQEAWKKTLV